MTPSKDDRLAPQRCSLRNWRVIRRDASRRVSAAVAPFAQNAAGGSWEEEQATLAAAPLEAELERGV
jgi:hypothetical protein